MRKDNNRKGSAGQDRGESRSGNFKKKGGDRYDSKPKGKRDESDRFRSEKKRNDSFGSFGDKFGKRGKSQYDNRSESNRSESQGEEGSGEKNFRKIYKGRGRDQKPVHEWVPADKVTPKAGGRFGAKKGGRVWDSRGEEERPSYNLKEFEKNHKKKDASELIRLNKYIANSGVCSRRDADALIEQGHVTVNGKIIRELGFKVKRSDKVTYKGKIVNPEKPVYLLLNKPKDFITTTDDPMERKTVMRLVDKACEERIFPVGRLDRNTTGLLLFTNDGELAAKLSHPSNKIKKIYQVTLDKPLTQNDEKTIKEGVTLEDGLANVDDMQVLSKDRKILGLEIHIGRNRIVRRLFAHLGYEVEALDRVLYAGLDKKDLPRGRYRFLSEKEVIRLKYF